jgi:hypothetical protein
MNKKMLKIQNINKILGRDLYSKWMPQTKGWAVSSVELVGDTYIFELVTTDGRWKGAEIQLRREPHIDANTFKTKYELWAWNMENSKPEVTWYTMEELDTVEGMILRLGMMLERMIPKN